MRTNRLLTAGLLLAGLAVADDPPRAVIELSWEADEPHLVFDLTSGTEYRVEERADLLTGDWEDVGAGHAVSGPDRHPLTTSAVSPRFFRLRYEDVLVDAGDGEDWGTFDFTVLSNRIEALKAADFNQGDGGLLVITNHVAAGYAALTHEETTPDEVVLMTRESYEQADAVVVHLTPDTVLDFFPAPDAISTHGEAADPPPTALSDGGTPGGVRIEFHGAHAFRADGRSRQTLTLQGNVVTAGAGYSHDFGQDPLGWEPPSLARLVYEALSQGPPMFDPYPPACPDGSAVSNARRLSVLRTNFRTFEDRTVDETYFFLFDYCYEYTCPNGPLRKIKTAFFQYRVVVRDRGGTVLSRKAQNAYFVDNQPHP